MLTAPVPVSVRADHLMIKCVTVLERQGVHAVPVPNVPDLARFPPSAALIIDQLAVRDQYLRRWIDQRKAESPEFGTIVLTDPGTVSGWPRAPNHTIAAGRLRDLRWPLVQVRLAGWQRGWAWRIRQESRLSAVIAEALAVVLTHTHLDESGPHARLRTLVQIARRLRVSREHLGRTADRDGVDLGRVADHLIATTALVATRYGGYNYTQTALSLGYRGDSGLSAAFDRSIGGYQSWRYRSVDDALVLCETRLFEPLVRDYDHIG